MRGCCGLRRNRPCCAWRGAAWRGGRWNPRVDERDLAEPGGTARRNWTAMVPFFVLMAVALTAR